MDTAERLSAARSVLMQAEMAVGLNVGRSLRTEDPEWADCECWDTPEPLSEIFPSGLRQGMTIGLQGSRLASLLLAGVASSQGAWVACLGIPDMSWAIASILGMNLDRTVCVPRCPHSMLPQAISAAIDGFDVVLVGRGVLELRDMRVLARRALSRRVLLLGEGWDTRLGVDGSLVNIEGTERGAGHISSLTLRLRESSGSGSACVAITRHGWKAAETFHSARGLQSVSLRGGKEAGYGRETPRSHSNVAGSSLQVVGS